MQSIYTSYHPMHQPKLRPNPLIFHSPFPLLLFPLNPCRPRSNPNILPRSSCQQLPVIGRFTPRQRTGGPIHNPLLPLHDHQIALPRTAVREDGHAALRVHHVVEVTPVVRRLPLTVRGDRGIGDGRMRGILREVGSGLDCLASTGKEV